MSRIPKHPPLSPMIFLYSREQKCTFNFPTTNPNANGYSNGSVCSAYKPSKAVWRRRSLPPPLPLCCFFAQARIVTLIPTLAEPAIALEITLSEPLCRRLQQLLDCYPNLSLDDLAHIALTNYLRHLQELPAIRS